MTKSRLGELIERREFLLKESKKLKKDQEQIKGLLHKVENEMMEIRRGMK